MSDLVLGFAVLAALFLACVLVALRMLRGKVSAPSLGLWLGAAVGFVAGAACGLLGFYLIFMAPQGQPFGVIDQGVLVIWATGPVGAIVGGVLGYRRVAV